jgi:hypothetical protein
MQLRVKHYLTGLAALLTLSMPVWSRTLKQTVSVEKTETLGSAQLSPGSYDLTADDSKAELNILQRGKVVATVPGKWNKLPKKASDSTVMTDGAKITEVQFSGSDQEFLPQ